MSSPRPEFWQVNTNPELEALNSKLPRTRLPSAEDLEGSLEAIAPVLAENGGSLSADERGYILSFAGAEVTGLELAFALTDPLFTDVLEDDVREFNNIVMLTAIGEGLSTQDAIRRAHEADEEILKRKLDTLRIVFNHLIPDPVAAAPGNEVFEEYMPS